MNSFLAVCLFLILILIWAYYLIRSEMKYNNKIEKLESQLREFENKE